MGSQTLYYFDNNATTRVAPEVVEAMLPYLTENWGNPSSAYTFGHQLGASISAARERVAALIEADPKEVIFTSCGTESINTALHCAVATHPEKRHVVTTAVEHSASLKYCAFLKKQGLEVTYLPVDSAGLISLTALEQAIRPDTAIVSVMFANNETGVLSPVVEAAAICRSRGVLFHTDAVQVPGKLKLNVKEIDPDFLSLSAHKLHAPKGIGALYVKRRTRYQPFLIGGGQERGRRGGTENVASIVAFGRAAELSANRLVESVPRVRALRDRLEAGILSRVAGSSVNGSPSSRLPNTTNIAFEGVEAEGILLLLDQASICVSSGSACTTGSLDPSHVLTAMGCSAARARSSIRFSLGIYNTEAEVDYVLEKLPGAIETLRKHAPVETAARAGI
jgi:cysteine desulfurase